MFFRIPLPEATETVLEHEEKKQGQATTDTGLALSQQQQQQLLLLLLLLVSPLAWAWAWACNREAHRVLPAPGRAARTKCVNPSLFCDTSKLTHRERGQRRASGESSARSDWWMRYRAGSCRYLARQPARNRLNVSVGLAAQHGE